MKPLFVLLAAFALTALVFKMGKKRWDPGRVGRIAMSCMLLFTASGHFIFIEGMSMMLPDFVPLKEGLIVLTGFLEIAFAVGLLYNRTQRITSLLLIAFLICILPSNIYAALKHLDIEKATYSGPGPEYLWMRIPLQLLFIGWVYYFGFRGSSSSRRELQ